MPTRSSQGAIQATVTLTPAGKQAAFAYGDDGSTTRARITPAGDIDLSREEEGPVSIRFQLDPTRIRIDDTEYDLEFTDDSLWMGPREQNEQTRVHELPQFRDVAIHGPELIFTTNNDDHRAWKYSLRVSARAADGRSRWLTHDPILINR